MDTPVVQPPIPPDAPPPPLPPKPKNYSGVLIGILLFLIGILVGLALSKTTILPTLRIPYLGVKPTPTPISSPTPTPDPTAGWKTYFNNDENFIIKYPNSWSEPTKSLQSTRATYVFTPNNLNIVVGFNYNQTLNRPETYDEELAETEKYAISKRNLSISSGKITIYTMGVGKTIFEETAIFKGKRENIIWITMHSIPEIDPAIFDQILSTFKFVDQNNQGTPAGGQRVNCPATRPQVCSMLCIQPPPYICGSDGKSYCSECQACSAPGVSWYITQNTPCTTQ